MNPTHDFGPNKYQYPEPQPLHSASVMTTSARGLQAIREREGLRLHAYTDVTGTRTIGYGHTGGVKADEVIDIEEAEALLVNDCRLPERVIQRAMQHVLTQSVFDALVSFGYNVGPARLKQSDVLRHVEAGDIETAAAALLGWSKSKGKHLPALFARRKSEAAQMLNLPW